MRLCAETRAAPVLDSSARRAPVEEASGKSTRQVERLLAGWTRS